MEYSFLFVDNMSPKVCLKSVDRAWKSWWMNKVGQEGIISYFVSSPMSYFSFANLTNLTIGSSKLWLKKLKWQISIKGVDMLYWMHSFVFQLPKYLNSVFTWFILMNYFLINHNGPSLIEWLNDHLTKCWVVPTPYNSSWKNFFSRTFMHKGAF
jgi:hypothetical protein